VHVRGDGKLPRAVERRDEAHARYVAHDGQVHPVITWIGPHLCDAEAADAQRAAGRGGGPLTGVLVGLEEDRGVSPSAGTTTRSA
jgi:Asp-tRNA(Asn)/Glu-tRNA(Gln) amidotransferase A subunit family amidase